MNNGWIKSVSVYTGGTGVERCGSKLNSIREQYVRLKGQDMLSPCDGPDRAVFLQLC